MAKLPSEILDRQVIQLFRTSGNNEHVSVVLPESAASGEIAIQLTEDASGTSLWTLAKDGTTPVQFVNKETVQSMIASGAVIEVDKIEKSIGLNDDGSIVSGETSVWGTNTKYFNSASTIVEAVKGLDENLSSLSGYVSDLDYSLVKDENKVVVSLAQVDGKISGTSENIVDVKLGTYVKDSAKTGAIEATDTLKDALNRLENDINANQISNTDKSINVVSSATGTVIDVNIKSGEHVLAKDGSAGVYTDIKLSGVTPSSTNVKEEYVLYGTDGTVLGEHIKVYKDSSLYQAYLGHVDDTITSPSDPTVIPGSGSEALCFIYLKTDGTYELVAVDVESFLQESEFKSGVTADLETHIVHGVVDPTSEEFLTVGADGFKLSGVQDAIDLAVEEEAHRAMSAETALDSVVGSVKADSGESRTYGHSGTNYLDGNTNVKADIESVDSLLGKVSDEGSANTEFTSTSTVARNITDIKKALDALKNKLNLSGLDNSYAQVTIVSADTGTTIEVSAKTQVVSAATAVEQGLADAYDVRTFAVSAVDTTSLATSAGVQVKSLGDDKVLDFTNLKVDCGEF